MPAGLGLAMVAGQEDDGLVPDALFLEFLDEFAQVYVLLGYRLPVG